MAKDGVYPIRSHVAMTMYYAKDRPGFGYRADSECQLIDIHNCCSAIEIVT